MTLHTPEKWKISDNTKYGWKTNPYSVYVQKKGGHTTVVANIPARATITDEEARANAALIASAPDLKKQVAALRPAAEAALRLLESDSIKCKAPLTLAMVVQALRDALKEQA